MRRGLKYRLLRCLEYICWVSGLGALLYIGLVWRSSAVFQVQAAKRLETLRQSSGKSRTPEPHDPLGRITIPRIARSAIIQEGVDEQTLRHAVGHFPESSRPELGGTVALAGHRDTFFRGLGQLQRGDLIFLETPEGKYTYEVARISVVGPQHVEVVEPSSGSDLTLVTCFPFHYIGPAPDRFVVQALRLPADGIPLSRGSQAKNLGD